MGAGPTVTKQYDIRTTEETLQEKHTEHLADPLGGKEMHTRKQSVVDEYGVRRRLCAGAGGFDPPKW